MRVASMFGLSGDLSSVQDDMTAINEIMSVVMDDLQNTHVMIIDVRGNDGGDDAVSLVIAGCFSDQKRLAVSRMWNFCFEFESTIETIS
jgi:C-terminal processing protease CtpA/Prc